MFRLRAILVTLLAGLLALGHLAPGAMADARDFTDIIDIVAPDSLCFARDGDTLKLRLYHSHDFQTPHPEITRAVYMVHGTRRNADDYFQDIVTGAETAGATATCFLVAPQYMVAADLETHELGEDLLYWQYMGWRQGDRSDSTETHPRSWRISSYAIADSILLRIADLCPNLEEIVVAGHSAGGQFANRIAAGTSAHDSLAARGVFCSYLVANPSTYLYFNENRWIPGTGYLFDALSPEQIAECPGYNNYKYGLDSLNAYMNSDVSTLRERFDARKVTMLIAEWDDNPWDIWLDRSCPAAFQGEHRCQRGRVYHEYLQHTFGPLILDNHALAMIYRAGHQHTVMFTSDCGLYYLFGYGDCWHGQPICPWTDITSNVLDPAGIRAASWGDYDGDGDADLFLSGNPGTEALLRNEGGDTFIDASAPPLPGTGNSVHATWIDVDNDGDLDLYSVHDPEPNRLLINLGGGAFADQTPPELALAEDCRHAAWSDYDLDGDLDLYLCRAGLLSNLLLRNEGALQFMDMTAPPLDVTEDTNGAAWCDYDNDGDPDLFVVNKGVNLLLRNDGPGGFQDASGLDFIDDAVSSSAVWADYNGDGNTDLFVANLGTTNRLYKNFGHGFRVVLSAALADSQAMTRGASWIDYNNDGRLDLYLANKGSMNRMVYNRGDGTFSEVGCHPTWDGRETLGAAWADHDGDGDMDLYLITEGDENWLLRNDNPARHWLQVDLEGVDSNRFGVGARVCLMADDMEQWREVSGAAGAGAQNSITLEFGLGDVDIVTYVQVFWPSGAYQDTLMVAVDQRILLVEEDGPCSAPPWQAGAGAFLHAAHPNPFTSGTTLLYDLPESGRVSLAVYDIAGRRVRGLVADLSREAGRHQLVWDGRDDAGRAVSAGVYLCRLETERGGVSTRRLVLVR